MTPIRMHGGEHSFQFSASDWLLTSVARGAWGFDGYITSDCDAVANVVAPHGYGLPPAVSYARPPTQGIALFAPALPHA